jgi:excisionase family DNA binding protein
MTHTQLVVLEENGPEFIEDPSNQTPPPVRLQDFPDVLTVGEVAQVLRIGRGSVYEAIKDRRIPSLKMGNRLLVPRCQLERILQGT